MLDQVAPAGADATALTLEDALDMSAFQALMPMTADDPASIESALAKLRDRLASLAALSARLADEKRDMVRSGNLEGYEKAEDAIRRLAFVMSFADALRQDQEDVLAEARLRLPGAALMERMAKFDRDAELLERDFLATWAAAADVLLPLLQRCRAHAEERAGIERTFNNMTPGQREHATALGYSAPQTAATRLSARTGRKWGNDFSNHFVLPLPEGPVAAYLPAWDPPGGIQSAPLLWPPSERAEA